MKTAKGEIRQLVTNELPYPVFVNNNLISNYWKTNLMICMVSQGEVDHPVMAQRKGY